MKKKYGAQTNICWTWKGRKREYFEFWKAEGRQSQIVEHSLELPSTGYYPPSREELWKMSQKLPPAVLQRNRNCLFGSLELPKLPLWTMITLQAILVLCETIWKSQKTICQYLLPACWQQHSQRIGNGWVSRFQFTIVPGGPVHTWIAQCNQIALVQPLQYKTVGLSIVPSLMQAGTLYHTVSTVYIEIQHHTGRILRWPCTGNYAWASQLQIENC